MKTAKKIIVNFIIGVGCGQILNLLFSFKYGIYSPGVPTFLENFSSLNEAVLVENILFGLLGIILGISSELFKGKDKNNLIKITISHYLVQLVPFIIIGYILRWFTTYSQIVGVLVSYTIIYIVVWLVNYLIIKQEIEKINRALDNIKN